MFLERFHERIPVLEPTLFFTLDRTLHARNYVRNSALNALSICVTQYKLEEVP
jgi:hypothetical protein